jgi:hypothetical protein
MLKAQTTPPVISKQIREKAKMCCSPDSCALRPPLLHLAIMPQLRQVSVKGQ